MYSLGLEDGRRKGGGVEEKLSLKGQFVWIKVKQIHFMGDLNSIAKNHELYKLSFQNDREEIEYGVCPADHHWLPKNIWLKVFIPYLCAKSLGVLTAVKFNEIKAMKIKCWKSMVRLTNKDFIF